MGGAAFTIQADLEQPASIHAFFKSLDRHFVLHTQANGFDILVNNAGVLTRAVLEDVSLVDLDRTFQINYKAPFLLIQHASSCIRSGGRIINVSSMATELCVS